LPAAIGGLELTASIDDPAPGQNVTITAQSYASDINAASISWTANGKALSKGVGDTSVTVQAPPLGSHTVIGVTAVTSDGQTFNATMTIGSGSVDLIAEPSGYIPPFFPGKLPASYQNSVKFVAIPHIADKTGKEYDPSSLVYQWKQNDTVLQSQSGYGKQSIVILGSLVPRTYTITVVASTRSGTAQAMGIMSVPLYGPSVAFYRDDPLYGPLLNKAIGSILYIGSQREAGILAVPYGFDVPSSGIGGLNLSWLINDAAHPELAGNDSVTLRAPDGNAGSSAIELDVNNPVDILQQAKASFVASFPATSTAAQQPSVNF
ncbi:MAG: hypothetical protein KGI69_03870, partial [Patescibacteria group bacterium]|nr:hypothetical protein [Patescibacteria group bacterium]